jgi:TolB protein
MNSDGTGVMRLTLNSAVDGTPDWSPDGTRIVFASTRDGNSEIYIMNADGTGELRLTFNAAFDGLPSW